MTAAASCSEREPEDARHYMHFSAPASCLDRIEQHASFYIEILA
jgi:hypothetical protein